jgi:pimeloyl-ACP methyl ester carboxylesterase
VRRSAAWIFVAIACGRAQSGDWTATLDFGQVKLRLALHLDGRPTLDSIDQDAFDLPLEHLARDGRALRFDVPNPGGHFEGEFSADGRRLDGWWTQRDGEIAIRFVPGNLRPQEPRPPYPYDQEDIIIRNGPIRLAGTLTIPHTPGPHPAVVLVTGSGPQDRNGTVSGHRPFLVWADYLTRRGFAVLRMDDRGVGGSTGHLLDSTDIDFARDLLAEVRHLRSRPDIDPRRVGVLGHSEGALVAAIAASQSRDIAFAVLLAAPALPGRDVLAFQSERIASALGIPDDLAAKSRQIQQRIFDARPRDAAAVFALETARLTPAESAVVRGQLGPQLDVVSSRWFRFLLDYDPRPALSQLRCPVLALSGALDLQVPPKPSARILPGLNHLFQHARTGSPLEYKEIEETVAPEVLRLVAEFLRSPRLFP